MRSATPCSVSPLISCIHSCLFSDWRRTVSFRFFDTQISSISTEEFVLPRHARCALSRLCCNVHSLLLSFYLTRIGRIENPLCSAYEHPPRTPLIPFCTFQQQTLCASLSLVPLYLSTSSGRRSGELPSFGAPWFSAMLPFLGTGPVTTTTRNYNTFYVMWELQIKTFKARVVLHDLRVQLKGGILSSQINKLASGNNWTET